MFLSLSRATSIRFQRAYENGSRVFEVSYLSQKLSQAFAYIHPALSSSAWHFLFFQAVRAVCSLFQRYCCLGIFPLFFFLWMHRKSSYCIPMKFILHQSILPTFRTFSLTDDKFTHQFLTANEFSLKIEVAQPVVNANRRSRNKKRCI